MCGAAQVDIFTPLRGVVKQLWQLWELMVLAEPLMVVGPTPGVDHVVDEPYAPSPMHPAFSP